MSLDEKILAIAFKDKKFALELSNSIDYTYFTKECQWIFISLVHFFKDPNIKSIPTVEMIKEYIGNDDNKIKAFNRIISFPVDTNEFGWLIKKIQIRHNDQVQKKITKKIVEMLKSNPEGDKRVKKINKIIKEAAVEIDAIGQKKMYKEGSLKNSAQERLNKYIHIKENPESARGILSGFSTFDRITNGLHAGEFMIVAGDTGGGKSILMHNMAVNAYLADNNIFDLKDDWSDRGNNILYFSLEMPKETMERRIDACISGVFSNHIRDGLLSNEDEDKYKRCLEFQKEYPKQFHIVDMPKGATTRDIEIKFIEILETLFRPDLVVIDYLGIMSPNNSAGSDWMDLGVISAELHEFARVYEIPVITGSQVNRTKDGVESYNTRRIARSSMVPNNANIILQIGCREDEDLRSDMPIFITKMRDGERGTFTLSKSFGKMKVVDIIEDTFVDEDDAII